MGLLRRATAVLGGALSLSMSATPALGQSPSPSTGDANRAAAAATLTGASLPQDTAKRLKSGDAVQIKAALDDVRVAGHGGAVLVPLIAQLLRDGLSPTLTQAALETLADTESETATEVVARYARHRNIALRRMAVEALAKTGGPGAAKALRLALADSDAQVRGSAATALGNMKARDAVGDLFAALDHKVPEAAASLGALCAGAECERLAAKLGSVPFDVVTTGLDEVLLRPPAEITEDLKIKIVGRLRELGTAESHHFLKGVQARWPARGSARVKQAIDQAILATASSPGSDGSEVAP
jgi:HEAT repeat protein